MICPRKCHDLLAKDAEVLSMSSKRLSFLITQVIPFSEAKWLKQWAKQKGHLFIEGGGLDVNRRRTDRGLLNVQLHI